MATFAHDHLKEPAGLLSRSQSGPLQELASGIDALYLSVAGVLRPDVAVQLETVRGLAGQVNRSLPLRLHLCLDGQGTDDSDDQVVVFVAPHGLGKYRYNCAHDDARIGVTVSRHLPTLRIQPKSEYLHGAGPTAAVEALTALAARFVDLPVVSVTRVDLYADWQGWDLSPADRDRFVTRADASRTYHHAGGLSGFDFGTRTSHTLTARIYDKTLDVARTGNTWWHDIWGDRYQSGQTVHRVGFEFARALLRESG